MEFTNIFIRITSGKDSSINVPPPKPCVSLTTENIPKRWIWKLLVWGYSYWVLEIQQFNLDLAAQSCESGGNIAGPKGNTIALAAAALCRPHGIGNF